MTEHFDKQTMLKLVREGREELQAFLAGFDEEQSIESHPPDGWSIKDMMAHIAFWEGHALERFREAGRGEIPQMFGNISDEEMNRINREALEAGRARTLEEVRAEFQRIHKELWSELEAMPESRDDGWWTVWPEPKVPWLLAKYNTYHHYEEHTTTLRESMPESK